MTPSLPQLTFKINPDILYSAILTHTSQVAFAGAGAGAVAVIFT